MYFVDEILVSCVAETWKELNEYLRKKVNMNQETMNEFQIKKNQILCWWKLVEGRQWAGKPCSGGSVFGPELWGPGDYTLDVFLFV